MLNGRYMSLRQSYSFLSRPPVLPSCWVDLAKVMGDSCDGWHLCMQSWPSLPSFSKAASPRPPLSSGCSRSMQVSKPKLGTAWGPQPFARSRLSSPPMIKKSGAVTNARTSQETACWPPKSASNRQLNNFETRRRRQLRHFHKLSNLNETVILQNPPQMHRQGG